MKKLLILIAFAFSTLCMMSCITSVDAQDDVYVESQYDTDLEIVIRYGTPYIVDGLVQYYLYGGYYYYPYYFDGIFHYHVYHHPLRYYPRYWRPVPHGYWFHNGRFDRPRRFDEGRMHNPAPGPDHGRPDIIPDHNRRGNMRPSSTRNTVSRPSIQNGQITRPNVQSRTVSRPSVQNGHTTRPSVQNRTMSRPNVSSRSVQRPSSFGRPSSPSVRHSAPSTMSRGGFSGTRGGRR